MQLDPNSAESQQYGQQVGYVQPNGQIQRMGLAQAQQQGFDPSKNQAVTIPYQQFMSLARGAPQGYMTQTQAAQQQYLNENISKIGENMSIRRFTKYVLGEGLEKKESDFAAEVAAAAGL